MRLPRPRLTVRRLMILVALAALGLAGLDLARRQLRLRKAEVRFVANRAWLDEGRITIDRFITVSRGLRNAQLGVCWTHPCRVAVARAHLDRSNHALEAEKRADELCLHCGPTLADIAEAEQMIDEDRAVLNGLLRPE